MGVERHDVGLFLICDGGYHRWKTLIPPYKHQIEGTYEAKWSEHIESLRKDVECTFGILKKRYAILKNRFRLHNQEDISDIFSCCCVLHNMLHSWDGYDDWEDVEEQVRQLEETARFDIGDSITMRDRSNPTVYQDEGTDELEIDSEFDERRSRLIEHFTYLQSKNYNVNRIR